MYQRLSAHISSVDIPVGKLDLSDLNWETARETAATIVVGKSGRSRESSAAAKLLSSRSASTASTDSAPQAKLRTASSVKEEEDQPHHQEVPRETDDNVFMNQ